MDYFFELLLAFIGELLIQLAAELVAFVGLRAILEPLRPYAPGRKFRRRLGHFLYGLVAGLLSLRFFPQRLPMPPYARLFSTIATPVLIAFLAGKVVPKIRAIPAAEARVSAFILCFTVASIRCAVFFQK